MADAAPEVSNEVSNDASAERAQAAIEQVMLRDRPRLRRWLRRLPARAASADVPGAAGTGAKTADREHEDFELALAEALELVAERRRTCPQPTYPPELPVVAERATLMEAIARHQVVVVCGETGSGKTTQLPKICLEMGRGVLGHIGHTQPRRIAARTVAARVAAELGQTVGQSVGYKVRFTDEVSRRSLIKVMTDGILLSEIRRDRNLLGYDTIIVDEAHERSLNIDFLLGYLKRTLPARPDLKVIVTSATLDPERIAAHFADAPIVNVSGRAYPVEVRYRPPSEESSPAKGEPGPVRATDSASRLIGAIREALTEVADCGPGDVLVFLAGEREIRDTAEALRRDPGLDIDILPLYARLNTAAQQKVFARGAGRRRVILATNVAETSVTVPGIRFVIDPGRARISRYSYRTKVQRLPVEPISRASANQRAGRCGRVGPGICLRLYSQEDFEARDEFTLAEIQRTNLASVILQMAAAKLGPIEDFPFIDPPDHRYVRDGRQLLRDLGATDEAGRLTSLGAKLARLPIDPQIGRMILASAELQCSSEVLVIASALSVGDPRDRSIERREAAAAAHEPFADSRSDFITYLNIWRFYQEQAKLVSRSQLRRVCAENYLSPGRMREWNEVYRQLAMLAREVGIRPQSEPATYGKVHRALLSGLLMFVGQRGQGREYRSMRGGNFLLSKGSHVSPRGARWLVAAELVETTRLYAHTAARVRPEWIERAAGALGRRTYFDVYWDARRGEVMAYERVALRGLTLIPKRRVRYEPIDLAEARNHFIWSALVGGEMQSEAPFVAHNAQAIAHLRGVEQKVRQAGLVVEDDQIFEHYDARLPTDVANRRTFERWWRAEPQQADALALSVEELLRDGDRPWLEDVDTAFPDDWVVGGLELALSYEFRPTSESDGVTAHVPLPMLTQLRAADFDWTVPGLLREKVIALLRSLPKSLRKHFVPIPDVADQLLARLERSAGSLLDALEHAIGETFGVQVPREAWRPESVPSYLSMSIAIDQGGTLVERGRDFEALEYKYAPDAQASFRQLGRDTFEQAGLTTWSFGELPAHIDLAYGASQVRAYPGIEDRGRSVALRLYESPDVARAATRAGVRRLFALVLGRELRDALGAVRALESVTLNYFFAPDNGELAPEALGLERGAELRQSIVDCVLDATFVAPAPERWSREIFDQRLADGRSKLGDTVDTVVEAVGTALEMYRQVRDARAEREHPDFADALCDIDEQLARLVYRGFVAQLGADALRELPRYLDAAGRRLRKLPQAGQRDERLQRAIRPLWQTYWSYYTDPGSGAIRAEVQRDDYRWMLEELRISAFAQEIGTRYSVSVRRCEDLWQARIAKRSSIDGLDTASD